jgi:NADH-quinone oxidoreductase subunit G
MFAEFPHLARIDQIEPSETVAVPASKMESAAFKPAVTDYYLTNPIARASELMGRLSKAAHDRASARLAAE